MRKREAHPDNPPKRRWRPSALQAVCITVAVVVVAALALIIAGVAILAGLAWSLIVAGVLLVVVALASGFVLLWEPKTKESK